MVTTTSAGGFLNGFAHPILGFDHLLAMVSVGLLSVQLGGRALYTVPATFVTVLGLGGALGLAGVPLPQVEGAIALSVFALGVAIASKAVLPMPVAMAFVAFFALFHGHAHGAEIPAMASPVGFVIGFMLASAMLHIAGIGIGLVGKSEQLRALIGAGIAGIGLHLLLLTYGVV